MNDSLKVFVLICIAIVAGLWAYSAGQERIERCHMRVCSTGKQPTLTRDGCLCMEVAQ